MQIKNPTPPHNLLSPSTGICSYENKTKKTSTKIHSFFIYPDSTYIDFRYNFPPEISKNLSKKLVNLFNTLSRFLP